MQFCPLLALEKVFISVINCQYSRAETAIRINGYHRSPIILQWGNRQYSYSPFLFFAKAIEQLAEFMADNTSKGVFINDIE